MTFRELKIAEEFRDLMQRHSNNVTCPKYQAELRKLKRKHGVSKSQLKLLRASLKYERALATMKEIDPRVDFYSAMDAITSFGKPDTHIN